MNLQGEIDEKLWRAIETSYESRNFTGAILDSIYFISDLIRDKADLDVDGASLAGQAFGGRTPKLRVNSLQTETERNVQAGVEQLLRGLYQAVRNPRSHSKYSDEKGDADALIVFVNHLVGVIGQSKALFSKETFLQRVFDPDFVKTERYAELLVDEIPSRFRLEVLTDVFNRKEQGDGKNLAIFAPTLLSALEPEQKTEFFALVSEELNTTSSDATIRCTLQMLPADTLEQISEVARMRVENKLIASIAKGQADPLGGECYDGALGTWTGQWFAHFGAKKELAYALYRKIGSENPAQHAYVCKYCWDLLTKLEEKPSSTLVRLLNERLADGSRVFYDRVKGEMTDFFDEPTEWVEPFKKAIEGFKEADSSGPPNEEIPF